ncbi:NmrA family NAD(P)-binding protein [Actinocatenispora sera]|uniref:NAD(P)-dependent oxidoreductase n=1 Tax=Actinocatenispora sera TaxID=390989 RepID=A0A810KY23_9ACTN|nr:NmrA family NAD(P)-binding protein [Actinocatenispora sera]BCJ27299.1 NAD(P)-dependent oxidoreductase [Actinocatenispora sera]
MHLTTGATGVAGSIVAREFARQGVPIRVLVRDPAKGAWLRNLPGIEIVVGDMRVPESLGAALDGVDRVLMISSPRDDMVGTQCRFIDAAKAAGVGHVVKFSGKESGTTFDPQAFRGTRWHLEIERYLEDSGLAWTHLQPSQFMQVYLPGALTGVDAGRGAIVMPIGDSRLAPVDIEDIARVAVAVMAADGIEGRAYAMTGPEALTMTEVAELLTAATGRPYRYEPVTAGQKRALHAAEGFPPEVLDLLDEIYAGRRGSPDAVVDLSTHRTFGVEPTTFADFARRHAGDFAPVPSA